MNAILAVDIGTQSTRASIVSPEGEIAGIAQLVHETDSPHPGWSQQRPAQWWDEAKRAIAQILEQTGTSPEHIAAVASCGQMHGPVGIALDGSLTTDWVQLWCDKRCAPQVEAVRSGHDEKRLMGLAGNPPNPAWTGLKLRWEKENNPSSYDRTAVYLVPKDFINFRLSGVPATDPTEASCSFLWDCNTQSYSQELAQVVGIDVAKLPPVHESFAEIGRVTDAAARETGLRTGTPVVAGGGDFPVSMLGFGLVGEGVTADVTGTSTLLAAHSVKPLVHPGIQNCRHAVDGFIPFTLLDCGGLSVKWCKDMFEGTGHALAYDDLVTLAERAPAGSDGLLFFPYMMGERRSENVNARGGKVGIGVTSGATLNQLMEVKPDGAGAAIVGRAAIGDWGTLQGAAANDFACFGHYDMVGTAANYCLLQNYLGDTFINAASGRGIYHRIGNANYPLVVSSGGDVGIGTSAPGAKLDVRGSAVFNEDGGDYDFRVEGDTDQNLLLIDAGNNRIGMGTDMGAGVGGCKLNVQAASGGGFALVAYGNGAQTPYTILGRDYQALYAIAGSTDTAAHIYHTSGTGKALLVENGLVGIGTTNPNAAALVEMNSTSKGFLPPRMTTTQRNNISSPPEGLVIYNTSTHKLQFYNGSSWGDV
jgi:xylulokinase